MPLLPRPDTSDNPVGADSWTGPLIGYECANNADVRALGVVDQRPQFLILKWIAGACAFDLVEVRGAGGFARMVVGSTAFG